MIRSLTGTLTDQGPGWVVVDVQGVGYLVQVNATLTGLIAGSTVNLKTYLAVRENALDLYGFVESTELAMFELLLGVPKVGPKSALGILSQATPTLLSEAAHKNDGAYLHKLSGIGKKTAENVVQYLHNKKDQLPSAPTDVADDLTTAQNDAIDALISLGYDATKARENVLALSEEHTTVNALVTAALKQIT